MQATWSTLCFHPWQTYRTIEQLRSEAKNALCFKLTLLNQLCSTNKPSISCLLQSGNECLQGCKGYSTEGLNRCFLVLLGNMLSQLKSLNGERNGNVSWLALHLQVLLPIVEFSEGEVAIIVHICISFFGLHHVKALHSLQSYSGQSYLKTS